MGYYVVCEHGQAEKKGINQVFHNAPGELEHKRMLSETRAGVCVSVRSKKKGKRLESHNVTDRDRHVRRIIDLFLDTQLLVALFFRNITFHEHKRRRSCSTTKSI